MHNISQLNSLCNTPDGILSNKEGILWRRSYFEEAQKEACNYAKNVLCHRHFSRNLVKIYRKAILTNFFWRMRSKSQQSTHPVMFSNPLMLVVTKGNTYLKSQSSHQLCSVKKLYWKIFRKFLENHLHHSAYWKLKAILNMSSVTNFFLRISPKYSEQLFIEKLLMDVQHFANKKLLDGCFWWGNTQKKFVEVNPPQGWPWKQDDAVIVAAVMILEVGTTEESCSG